LSRDHDQIGLVVNKAKQKGRLSRPFRQDDGNVR
jgi:hypothetical protein